MPAASTRAALSDAFKTIYKGDLTNRSKRKTPLGSKVKKVDDFYGESLTLFMNWGLNHGIHPTLSATLPSAVSGKVNKWIIPETADLYGRLTLDNPSMMRASKDIGSFIRIKAKEVDGILSNLRMQRLGTHLWADGAGDLAQIESVTGSNPITAMTLTSYQDAVKFEGGGKQRISVATTRTGGTLKVDGVSTVWIYKIDKVDRYNSLGKTVLTVSLVAGTGATTQPAAADYIYNYGQYDTGPKGIGAWIPAATPSATTFFNMDRSVEPQMFAGWRGTWEGNIADTAKRLASVMSSYMDPDYSAMWLSEYRWYQLEQELTAQGRFYVDETKSKEFGTAALRMITPGGSVSVMCDPFCPNDSLFLLKHDEIEIHSTGPLIHMCDEDLEALRLSDSDGVEIRYRSLAQTAIPNPFSCGRAPITQN